MNKDKQIEEMCEVLRKNAVSCQTCIWYAEEFCIGNCELAEDNQMVCETLYNAGYRKASEVAGEIFEEIEDALFDNHCVDDGTDFPTPHYLEELKDDIAELKKKYTEDGE